MPTLRRSGLRGRGGDAGSRSDRNQPASNSHRPEVERSLRRLLPLVEALSARTSGGVAMEEVRDYLLSDVASAVGHVRAFLHPPCGNDDGLAAANEVLSRGSACTALLRLATWYTSLKPAQVEELLDPGGPATACQAQQCCLLAFQLLGPVVRSSAAHEPPPHVSAYARDMLRMQVLPALSRQMAAAAAPLRAQLTPHTGEQQHLAREQQGQAQEQQGQAREQQGQAREQHHAPRDARKAAWHTAVSISHFAVFALVELLAFAGCSRDGVPQHARFVGALAESLYGSHVIEHAARLLLLVEETAPQLSDQDAALMAKAASLYGKVYTQLFATQMGRQHDAAGALMSVVLRGPCVQHCAVVHCLAALCAADGGPAYGLTPALLRFVDCDDKEEPSFLTSVAQAQGQGHLPTALFLAALAVLHPSYRWTAWPPRLRASFSLVMRIGRLLLASGQGAAGGSSSGSGQRVASVAVCTADLPLLAGHVVQCSWLLWMALQGSRKEEEEEKDDWAAQWGQLAVGLLRHVVRVADYKEQQQPLSVLGGQLAFALRVQDISQGGAAAEGEAAGAQLPSAAPPGLAAALAAGLLPCMERLLRRAGEKPQVGGEASVAGPFFSGWGCSWPFPLTLLLAYGEPRQAASLVATIGKLLRRAVGPADLHVGSTSIAGIIMRSASNELNGYTLVAAALEAQEATAASTDMMPARQLQQLLSHAAAEWLPVLSRVGEQALRGAAAAVQQTAGSGGSATNALAQLNCMPLLHQVLAYTGVLAADCMSGEEEPENSGPCRRMLLDGVGAVPLLGAVMQFHPSHYKMSYGIALSCCVVAAACPQQVRLATQGAAAKAGAVAVVGSSGAGARGSGSGGGIDGRSGGGMVRPTTSVPGGGGSSGGATQPGCCLPWQPEWLHAVAAEMKADRRVKMAAVVSTVATQLDRWRRGEGRGAGGPDEEAECVRRMRAAVMGAYNCWYPTVAARVLAPTAETRALMLPRSCAYPACVNLAGDSEAEMQLKACGQCGQVWYCCRECQTAHWRAGHKATCAGGRGG